MAGADIAVIGLAVMGQNLVLNMAEKGFRVAIYNRTVERVDETLVAAGPLADKLVPCHSIVELVAALEPPRTVLLMVKAGTAVDESIAQLKPHLSPGDCIIDAGNADYHDSMRRDAALKADGLDFLGVGVSGGEEGARHGPSIMAGGAPKAFERIGPLLTAIAARYEGTPCAAYLGPAGAGHFVKTLHNGIEYADMEMIAEIYGLMRDGLGLKPAAMAEIFERWTKGPLASYLIEITAQALRTTDPATGRPIVDVILDSAGQKGTGRWSAIEALDLGVAAGAIVAAVEARGLSSAKALRAAVSKTLGDAPRERIGEATPELIADLEKTLLAGKILAYAQGFEVMATASARSGWTLPLDEIARIWRAGCIIRSSLLDRIAGAYAKDAGLASLLLDEGFAAILADALPAMQRVLGLAIGKGHAAPSLAAGLSYLQQLRSHRTTLDLVQAQRDIFGAHGFERIDQPGTHHGPWGGTAG
ncbi:NADP-dependent phosphogluconate dehydrogenase [Labrys wisconsinensis]|uniref:6-phosphogluconate dehydrogenase, decarboxylating n=1 Tax=Labrys wisconsinensis TaxID=425677 RepID=A0ABU0J0R8_9HYPH|nr:NADP-dependent phosphogluconate dehydrogenase [Labrys wisconsinensis]MDQ0467859.1 6-phosphogluconate dehydrogenase [Labrys wisconsinensis]